MKKKKQEINVDCLCGILKDCRIEMGYTQQKIADYLHIDRSTYTKYETGRKPEIDTVALLAELYGINIGEMLNDFCADISNQRKTVTVKTPNKSSDRLVRLNAEEQRLIDYFRNCSDKTCIMDFAHKSYIESAVDESGKDKK